MKNYLRFMGMILLVAAMAVTACQTGDKDNNSSNLLSFLAGSRGTNNKTAVTIAAIPGIVPPVRGESPVIIPIETAQYTGNVSWSPNDDTFKPETVYTAYITLAAKSSFTMNGVAANFFTIAGADSVTNSAESNIVSAVFRATGAAQAIDVNFQSATQAGGASCIADSTGLLLLFDKSPGTLTADNITVTGATKGILSGPGTTMYLAISNITAANGGTVAVTITSPSGYSISGSTKTTIVYRAPYIGMSHQGGVIAYILQSGDPGYVAGQVHGLIAATADQGSGIVWISGGSTQTTSVPGGTGTALGTGSVNTDRIIAQAVAAGNTDLTTYAAGLARAYNAGGYTGWYLPSRDELNQLYGNRAEIGGFVADAYLSSSEDSATYARYQVFNTMGSLLSLVKTTGGRVRAVRAF